jgi:hypothetical protein
MLRLSRLVVLAALAFFYTGCENKNDKPHVPQSDPAGKGWSVKVCPNETKAETVEIWLGLPGKPETQRFWKKWNVGDPVEIQVPDEYRYVPELWIKATATPENRSTHLCLKYGDQVTQKMSFDKQEEKKVKKDAKDTCGC